MSYKTLPEAIDNAKKFAMDTAIVQHMGDFTIIRLGDVPTIPESFKHVATVRCVITHEVTHV